MLEDTLRSARELIAKYGDTAKSMAHDTAKLKDKASDTLVEHTEARPFTTLAAIVGIGFLAGWLFRRQLSGRQASVDSSQRHSPGLPMIGPLLRVAASAAAARSLRLAAHDASMRVV